MPNSSEADRTQSDQSTGRIGTLIVLTAAAAISWALLTGPYWLLAIFPLPAAAILIYFILAQPDKERLIESGIMLIVIPITLFLLQALVLWFVVNFIWAAGDEAPISVHYTLAPDDADSGSEKRLTITLPQTVLFDEPRNEVELRLSPEPAQLASPLAVTLTLDDSLRFVSPGRAHPPGQVVFEATSREQQEVIISRAAASDGFRPEGGITVTAALADHTLQGPATIPIRVEGRDGFAVRQFINSTVDRASPVILLLTVLVPGLGALLQSWVSRARGELMDQRRQEFDRLWEEFQMHFLAKNKEKADEILKRMEGQRFRAFKESGEIHTAGEFLQFARLYDLQKKVQAAKTTPDQSSEGTTPDQSSDAQADDRHTTEGKAFLERTQKWPQGWVAAYIMAREEAKEIREAWEIRGDGISSNAELNKLLAEFNKLLNLLKKAKLKLPYIDLTNDKDLQDDLQVMETDSSEVDAERWWRNWPIVAGSGLRRRGSRATAFATDNTHMTTALRLPTIGVFWPGHSTYRQLIESSRESFIITSQAGNGRTTLARQLPLTSHMASLVVPLKAGGGWPDVTAATAERLLLFSGNNPPWIGSLSSGQLEDLARLLVEDLGLRNVLAALTRQQHHIAEIYGLEDDREKQTQAREQLQLLKSRARDVADHEGMNGRPAAGITRNLTDRANRHFLYCVEALGFKGLLLVFDLAAQDANWLNNFVLRDSEAWHAADIHFAAFIPEEINDAVQPLAALPVVDWLELRWTQAELEAMIDARLEHVDNPPRPYPTYFTDTTVSDDMIKKSGDNPRQLIGLWRKVIEKKAGNLKVSYITQQDVDEAWAEIKS